MTPKLLRGLGFLAAALGALMASAAAQSPYPPPPIPPAMIPNQATPIPAPPPPGAAPQVSSNPACVRLEAQLASLTRGITDPARIDQIKRYDEAIAKQQADLDRVLAQSKKRGCEGGGFFALFTGRSPACEPLTTQIQQMRDRLDRMMSELERVKSGSTDQEGQRRALIGQLAQNNCGPQYRAAAATSGPGSFLDALFSGKIINPGGDGAPSGTYQTVCVRSCDGYYFPISYSTVPNRFADDARACQRECPAAEAQLYTYRNPGEDIGQAVSLNGQPYSSLPSAFLYRKQYVSTCSCRRPGQSWADALKNADNSTTLEAGDIVVTDQNAKALSEPPQPRAARQKRGARDTKTQDTKTQDAKAQDANTAAAPNATPAPQTANSPSNGAIRVVGPPFIAH